MGGSEPHLWLISQKEERLVFQRKNLKHLELSSQIPEIIRNSDHYENLFNAFYDYFYINFYWKDNIPIEVINVDSNAYTYKEDFKTIKPENFTNKFKSPTTISRKMKVFVFETLRKLLGGVDIDIFSVIACPFCKQRFEPAEHRFLICKLCNVKFPIVDDIPFLVREFAKKL